MQEELAPVVSKFLAKSDVVIYGTGQWWWAGMVAYPDSRQFGYSDENFPYSFGLGLFKDRLYKVILRGAMIRVKIKPPPPPPKESYQ